MPFASRSRTAARARGPLPGGWTGRLETLDDRIVPSILVEVEPNDSLATAQLAPIATGDITTTAPDDWLIIQGAIATSSDTDVYQFTINSASGVFFDLDSRETGLSTTLDSTLTLFFANGAQHSINDDGYDFEGFAVPTLSVGGLVSDDSSLYADLAAGTYYISVSRVGGTTGNYHLRLLADSNYSSTVPVFHSNTGAADTLYLDFDGHSATDAWGTYTAAAYDFNGSAGQFSPAERLAIFNAWRVIAEDYSPFQIDITTAPPGTIANGVGHRQVITNSDSTIVSSQGGVLGIAFVNSYTSGTASNNVSFTFAGNFSPFGGGGPSGRIMATPVEIGNTTAHEFGHALGLAHYNSQTGGTGSVIPSAIMATPDLGLNRETWAVGTNTSGNSQDDMAVISNTTNTFGYRADDHGGTTAAATVLTAAGDVYTATGIVERIDDRDLFRIIASGATTIQLEVFDYVTDLDTELRLLDASGNQIASSAPAGWDASITQTLAQGTYYVDVRGTGAAGMAGRYSLRIDTIVHLPPVLSAIESAPLAYTENQTLTITSSLAVSDPDSPNLTGATVSIAVNYVAGQDELLFTTQNGITGSFANGVLSLSGTATVSQYQAALRSVQYRNVSENPSTATRTVLFRVTDPDGVNSNFVSRNIAVTAVNDPPVAAAEAYSTAEDQQLIIAAPGVLSNDTDVDNASLTAVLVGGPQHGTLTLNADGSFTYTPAANYNGPDTFTYKANDGQADSAVVTVSLTVTSVPDVPVAGNDSYTVAEDGILTVNVPGVLANDSDGDGDPLTAILVNGAAHGTLALASNGSFTYTPAANFNGTDSFTYQADDGQVPSTPATVTINVTAVNDAPVAVADAYSVAEDGTLSVAAPGVRGNDSDVDNDPLTAIKVTDPANGSLTFNADGSFSYTPNANFHGTDSFTYKVSDGITESSPTTVTITVTSVNDAPVAVGDSYALNEDAVLTVPAPGVKANDTDVEGDPLAAFEVSGPTHGSLTFNPDGSFTYTPVANYFGPDSFSYKLNDGTVDSATVSVGLTILSVNDAPVAGDDSASVQIAKSVAIKVLDNDTDVDGGPLSVTAFTQPSKGSVSRLGGTFTYTPFLGMSGPDSFTYTVSDGNGGTDTATVSLTIIDFVAPTIKGLRVRYGASSRAFVDLRSMTRSVLPWANVTRFEFVFSENVQVDADDLTLTGALGGPVALNFAYNPSTRTATWSASTTLAIDRYTLRLIGTGPTGVQDGAGNLLGSDWARTFGVLPGDFDANGVVDDRDLGNIRRRFNRNPALANRFADVNGDGIVDQLDYNLAKANRGLRLP